MRIGETVESKACPLVEIRRRKDGYYVQLGKYIDVLEGMCDCDLEGPLEGEYGLPKRIKSLKGAQKYAQRVSDTMDEIYLEEGGV